MEPDKLGNRPEVVSGIALALSRQRAQLREKKEALTRRSQSSSSTKGTVLTAIVVIVALIATLTLMLYVGN